MLRLTVCILKLVEFETIVRRVRKSDHNKIVITLKMDVNARLELKWFDVLCNSFQMLLTNVRVTALYQVQIYRLLHKIDYIIEWLCNKGNATKHATKLKAWWAYAAHLTYMLLRRTKEICNFTLHIMNIWQMSEVVLEFKMKLLGSSVKILQYDVTARNGMFLILLHRN